MNVTHSKADSEGANYVKVVVELANSDWHSYATESLWATSTEMKDVFRIENIPFCAYGVSYQDLITIKFSSDMLLFKEVYQKCGHSTYRIFLSENCSWDKFEMAWKPLVALGCSYEQATERLISVDIPPATNIYQAYALLEKGERNQIWDFEEAHCGHSLKQ
jgi:Domain of unknown function (DUF4265)